MRCAQAPSDPWDPIEAHRTAVWSLAACPEQKPDSLPVSFAMANAEAGRLNRPILVGEGFAQRTPVADSRESVDAPARADLDAARSL